MDSPVAYIPVDRRLAMSKGQDLPDRTHGAALFADISGFTPLTEALARELGPKRGAEELTKQLDTIYGALIAEVERYRGSVIGFAGDAITCWFDGDSGFRAAACALAMQAVMQQFLTVRTPSGNTVSLAIKVSIASGPVRRFRIGDRRIQYIDALAGATLDRMAAAEHHANKGEVVVTEEVAGTLDGKLRLGEWRNRRGTPDRQHGHDGHGDAEGDDGPVAVVEALAVPAAEDPWPQISEGALDEADTRPWILPGVYERLMSGQGQYLAEIRPVVALFLRFGGIDYDADEAAGEKLDAFIKWVQNILTRYEGSLLQLIIGDKGSVLYSAFGAPLAHDDDPARAVAAALELQAMPPELAYIGAVQIGISRGRMRVGPYGGPTRRTYGLLGDDVNLAARLMQRAAPGQILVSRRIAEAAGSRYNLLDLGTVTVKGKEEPIPVFQVAGSRGLAPHRVGATFESRLVGRDAELDELARALDSVLEGGGQALSIEGAAGVGKSHLVAELERRALERGMLVAPGACQSTSVGSAYAPWKQLFRTLLGLGDESAGGEEPGGDASQQVGVLEALITGMNPDWLLRLPLLGDLLGLPIPDNATTAAFDPRLRQSALFDLAADIVRSFAQGRGLLLVIDDVHWMDEASQGLTVAVARVIAQAPVLLTLVHRPPLEGQQILPDMDALPSYRKLNLDELSADGVAALIANRLGAATEPLALALIQSVTQGNPFFVEEVVDSLREAGTLYADASGTWVLSQSMTDTLRRAGALVREGGRWALAPRAALTSVDLGLPDSVEGIVLSRIDRLPEAYKLTLRVASVVGRTFALDLVASAHPLRPTESALAEQVNALESRDFARLDTPPPRPVYMFKHNVTRDVAYETLLFVQRRELHRAVGEALEQLDPEATGQLAYHTYLGEDWPRALRYQMLAGEQAQKLFANHEGIEHFRNALRCAGNLSSEETAEQQRSIHTNLGTLLTYTGQYEPALEHLNSALQLAVEMDDPEAQATACRWIAYLYEYRGELAPALEWIERGLQALGERETASTAELLAIAGLIQTRLGNYDTAQEQCERSISVASTLGDVTALAFASNARAIVSLLRGNSASAIEYFKKALELYEQDNNIHGQAMSSNGIANVYSGQGQWTEADKYYRQAREVFSQSGDVLHQAFADNNLGNMTQNQGKLDEALAFYQDSLTGLAQIGGSAYVIGAVHMNLGAALVRRGELEQGLEHLTLSEQLFAQANARDFLSEMHRHFAKGFLLAGKLDEAVEHGTRAVDLARELTMRAEEGSALRVVGEISAAKGDLPTAEEQLSESCGILQEVGDEYELARSQLALAQVYRLQGKHEQEREVLERCLVVFERLEARLDLAAARKLQNEPVGAR